MYYTCIHIQRNLIRFSSPLRFVSCGWHKRRVSTIYIPELYLQDVDMYLHLQPKVNELTHSATKKKLERRVLLN